MASSYIYTQTTPRPRTEVKCKPKGCPTCGSQECIERPRFFCGQLLTDKDLDAAQRYVIEKNRLHNRYLVGDGVVCGLAVRCDDCDGCSVTIDPGYAIDCCGNDIVLCEPVPFDVCDYIDKCLTVKTPGCEDKIRPPSRCDDQPKTYCLFVSYNEEQTSPVTALIRDNGCKNTRCEPSRTKETFRFDLIAEDQITKANTDDFFSRLRECFDKLFPQAPGARRTLKFSEEFRVAFATQNLQSRHAEIFRVFCRLKDYTLQLYQEHNVRCELGDEFRDIEGGFPSSPDNAEYLPSILRMYARLFQFFKDCFCDALLVPCAPCGEGGVLVACLTVYNKKVLKICNTVRKFVITGPALRYWLGPLFRGVGKGIDRLCCGIDIPELVDGAFALRELRAQRAATMTNGVAERDVLNRETTRTEDLSGGLGRIDALQRMLVDYASAIKGRTDLLKLASPSASAAFNNIRAINFATFFQTDTVSAVDLYGKPSAEAGKVLGAMNLETTVTRATADEHAYAARNLAEMNWEIKPNSKIELVVDANDRVTAVRVLGEANNP